MNRFYGDNKVFAFYWRNGNQETKFGLTSKKF